MQIKFHGHSCLSITDKDFTVVTDPYDESTGLQLPDFKADVITVSYKDPHHANIKGVGGEPKIFSWPGEYETGGSHFKGIVSFHNSKEDEEQKMQELKKHFTNLEQKGVIRFDLVKVEEDNQKALDDYVADHGTEIICFQPHKRSVFYKLFTKNLTKKNLFSTNIPLLAVPDK